MFFAAIDNDPIPNKCIVWIDTGTGEGKKFVLPSSFVLKDISSGNPFLVAVGEDSFLNALILWFDPAFASYDPFLISGDALFINGAPFI